MDLFDKCRQFDLALHSARARDRFFFSRAIAPAAAPLTARDGRERINLGSNNYLGLAEHPKVKAAAAAAVIAEYGTGSAGSWLLTGTTPLHRIAALNCVIPAWDLSISPWDFVIPEGGA